MNYSRKNRGLWTQSKFLVSVFITLAILMIVSSLFELYQSKKELYRLMEKQAQSLMESIMISSKNSLLTNERLSILIEERLLNNAVLINILYENDKITNTVLNDICDQNNIYRINIFNKHYRSTKNAIEMANRLIDSGSPVAVSVDMFYMDYLPSFFFVYA